MTTIVIGAGGFLGAALHQHFAGMGEVLALSYRPEKREAFLAEFEAALTDRQPVAVINAGASQNGKDDPSALAELVDSNVYLPAVLGSLILTNSPQTRLINFGTSWQIGEQGESSPFNAYAAAKAAAEPFLDHFTLSGLKAATLRLYDTYGPADKRNKVVNLIADALNARSELSMSAGGQLIDLVHIDDVLSAVDTTLELLNQAPEGVHHVYAVRSGKPLRILEVLALLMDAAGMEKADFITLGIYPYRKRERFALFADTPTPPGWCPRIELVDGLKAMLDARRLTS